MLAFLKRLAKRWSFSLEHRDEWTAYFRAKEDSRAAWLREQAAISKSCRLALIVRERNSLKDELAKAIRQKKARAPIYQALRALSIEELRVVSGHE